MSGSANDGRSPLAVALTWVHQISAVSLEMVLPAVLGHYLDRRWGTEPWLVIVGAVIGFSAAMAHLLQMVGILGKSRGSAGDDSNS